MKTSPFWKLYLDHKDGEGGGASDDGKKTEESSSKDGEKKTSKEGDAKTSKEDEPKFTQTQINSIVANELQKEREKQARKLQEEEGKFKDLYEQVKPKYEEAENQVTKLKTDVENLAKEFHALIDEQIKDWPEEIRDLDPGVSDIKTRKEWVAKAAKAVAKIKTEIKAPNVEQGNKGKDGKQNSPVGQAYMASRYGIHSKSSS